MDEYQKDFVQESEENITELNNALLELEHAPDDDEAMGRIFRMAHTLKGNSGAMGFEAASNLAHAIEDLLEAVRSGNVEVTSELMDEIFAGVDELETMVDEVRTHGEIRTDPSDTIETIRGVQEAMTGVPTIGTPDEDAIDDAIEATGELEDEDHNVFYVRLAIDESGDVAHGSAVVHALADAFDLLGTIPDEETIAAGDYDGTFDAVFGSAVGEAAITAALDPVDAVSDARITEVSEAYERAQAEPEPESEDGEFDDLFDEEEPGSTIDPDAAQDMSVDDLLSEFDEYDDLDAMVEEMEDVSGFDDLGDAGSFDDLDIGDEIRDEPESDSSPDAEDDGFGDGLEDDLDVEFDEAGTEDAPAESTEPVEDPDEQVDDAAATFAELKQEVDPVGFDELQDELDELEFDEYSDEEEVGFDELLGDDFEEGDDDFFMQDTERAVGTESDEVTIDDLVGDDEVTGFEEAEDDTPVVPGESETDAPADADDAVTVADAEATDHVTDTVDADTTDEAVEAEPGTDAVDADAGEDVEVDASADAAEGDAAVDESADAADSPADDAVSAAANASSEDAGGVSGEASADFGDGFGDEDGDTIDTSDFDSADFDDADFELGAADPADTASAVDSTPDDDADPLAYDDDSDEESAEDEVDDEPESSVRETDDFDSTPSVLGDDDDLDAVEVRQFELDDPDTDVESTADVETGDFGTDAGGDEVSVGATTSYGDFDDLAADDGFDAPTTTAGFDDPEPTDESSAEDESVDDDETQEVSALDYDVDIQTLTPDPDEGDGEEEVQSIRVDIEQVDRLLNLVEGLVTSRVRLRRTVEEGADPGELTDELDELEDLTGELQDTVMDVRLVPVQIVANKLPRVVRDISREQDKQVDFEMNGESVELDRSILSEISDPLVHIVRNAVDHGIEPPEEREEVEKPTTGNVTLTVERARDQVVIEVEDDGRGLNSDRLREAAVDADVLTGPEAEAMSDAEVHELIFHPGLSTAPEVTDVSGRGVGMDVVKRTVNELDGSVSVESEPGEGTTIEMRLPVTVAIADVLFVTSGDEEFGVPTKVVRDIGPAADISVEDGQEVVREDDDAFPVVRLHDALETPGTARNGDGMVLRIRDGVRPVVVHCDEVRGQQEVVVKPFEGVLGGIPGLSGATVLGEGEVVNILDVKTL